jgi:ribosome-associated heat shock protein Hsp15
MDDDATMRIDKWLWAARFFKTRGAAHLMVSSGRLKLDGDAMSKPHRNIRAGNVLTFPMGDKQRMIKVLKMAEKRGPAPEAALLYEDLAPPEPKTRASQGRPKPFEFRDPGSGRPTKRERRKMDQLKS